MRLFKTVFLSFIVASLAITFDTSIITNAEAKIGRYKGRKSRKTVVVENVWERLCSGLRIPIYGPSPYGSQQLATLPSKTSNEPPNIFNQSKPSNSSTTNEKTGRVSSVIIPKKTTKDGNPPPSQTRVTHVLGGKKSATETADSGNEDTKKDHYTALGRLKLAPKEPKDLKLRRLFKSTNNEDAVNIEGINDSGLFKQGTLGRMRARLSSHPELFKNVKPKNDGQTNDATLKDSDKSETQETGTVTKPRPQLVIRSCADFNKSSVIPLVKQGLLSQNYMQLAEQCRLRQNASYARISRHLGGYGKEFLQQVGERARPFLFHIVDTLSKRGLPMDLALLPIVESAYQPTALSSAKAAGIWQFIPSTGKAYGLKQTEEYDARLHVTAETEAAAKFLAALRDHYGGDWWLALAAYNAGPGTVAAAISRNVAAGLGRDFWSLELPQETMDYVPRLLALSSTFRRLGANGLKLRPLKNEPYFVEVSIERDTDLKRLASKDLATVAQLASYDAEEFKFLNTAYIKPTLPSSKPLNFLLPIRNANMLHQSLAFLEHADKTEKLEAFPVELFAKTAQTNTEIPTLAITLEDGANLNLMAFNKQPIKFNGLEPDAANANGEETAVNLAHKKDWIVHYLDKDETLETVAEHHGIDEAILREVNNFKRKQIISMGQRLLVPLKLFSMERVKKRHPSVLFNGLS